MKCCCFSQLKMSIRRKRSALRTICARLWRRPESATSRATQSFQPLTRCCDSRLRYELATSSKHTSRRAISRNARLAPPLAPAGAVAELILVIWQRVNEKDYCQFPHRFRFWNAVCLRGYQASYGRANRRALGAKKVFGFVEVDTFSVY